MKLNLRLPWNLRDRAYPRRNAEASLKPLAGIPDKGDAAAYPRRNAEASLKQAGGDEFRMEVVELILGVMPRPH